MSLLTPTRAAALRREREGLAARVAGCSQVIHGSYSDYCHDRNLQMRPVVPGLKKIA
jgi:hypothetical protein